MDVLKEHPELATSVLKVLSDALTASQQEVQALQRQLAEQFAVSTSTADASALSEENARLTTELTAMRLKQEASDSDLLCTASANARLESELAGLRREHAQQLRLNIDLSLAVAGAEGDLTQVRAEHVREKTAGDELRAALEGRYIDIRSRETAVESQTRAFALERAAVKREREEWSLKEAAHAKALEVIGARCDAAGRDRDALKAMLGDKNTDLETQEGALKRAIETSDRATRESTEKLEQMTQRLQDVEAHKTTIELAREALAQDVLLLSSQKDKCTQDIQTLDSLYNAERARRAASDKTLQDKNAEVLQLQDEVERLKKRIMNFAQASKGEVDRLGGIIDSQRAENSELHDNFLRLGDQCTELNALLLKGEAAHETTISDLRKQNALLLEENAGIAQHGVMVRDDLMEQFERQKEKHHQLTQEHDELKSKYEERKISCVNHEEAGDADLLKLREENKNLRSSVLAAGAQAREQLQQTFEMERAGLQGVINAQQERNRELENELGSMRTQYAATTGDLGPQSLCKAEPVTEHIACDPVRGLYDRFMARFPTPANRPRFKTLLPVDTVKPSNNMYFFLHNVPTQRQYRHFPDRTLWSGPDGVHAIVYHPTHEYWPAVQKWVTPPSISFLSPELFDLFLTSQNAVYYVGVYAFHSMRDVHPPGSPIPPDVSPVAIHQATGVPAANVNPWDKITECFLDGHIKVECFGLQCVGFDHELYHKLRLRFVQPAGGEVPLKRRADDVDLRKGGYARARPV